MGVIRLRVKKFIKFNDLLLFMKIYLAARFDKKQEVRDLCEEALERNIEHFNQSGGGFTEECRILINVSRGPLSIYREVFELTKGEKWNEPNWIINVWPLSRTSKTLSHYFETGANADSPLEKWR